MNAGGEFLGFAVVFAALFLLFMIVEMITLHRDRKQDIRRIAQLEIWAAVYALPTLRRYRSAQSDPQWNHADLALHAFPSGDEDDLPSVSKYAADMRARMDAER